MNTLDTHWQDQYQFWHKILSEEVDRLRFNGGLEPIDLDLYQLKNKRAGDPLYVGICRVGQTQLRAIAFEAFDAENKRVLRVQIRAGSKS